MKAIVESFEGSGILVTQTKASLQTTDIATQLFKIKGLVKFMETMESANYTIKEAVQAIQTCSINRYIKKRMQNNDISKWNMERLDISLAVYSLLQHSQPTTASAERCFFILRKLLAKKSKFKVENVKE